MSYKLIDIVSEYIIEGGGSQENQMARLYQIAVSGMREFNMNSSGITKTARLPIKVNDTCDLPQDYLQYSTIGLIGSDGVLHSLGRNDSLALYQSVDDCGSPTPPRVGFQSNEPNLSGWNGYAYYDPSITRNGEFMGRLFGVKGGQNPFGEFRIDRANGLILLSRLTNISSPIQVREIFIEYMSDINSVDGEFEVHPFMVEAIKCWIDWTLLKRGKSKGTRGERNDAERIFHNEARKTKNRFNIATIREYKAAFRHGNTASVKF